MLNEWEHFCASLVTPSEVVSNEDSDHQWAHRIWADSAMLGDVLCGAWDVAASSTKRCASSKRLNYRRSPITTGDLYRAAGRNAFPDENGRLRKRAWSNSSMIRCAYVDSNAHEACASSLQLAHLAFREV